MRPRWLLLCALAIASCSSDITNAPAQGEAQSNPVRWHADPACIETSAVQRGDTRETLARRCRTDRRERDFIAVALSGGGTKAAVFSAESMFYLEALGLLRRTSVLSSVSGGSFAAALYAISCDPGDQATNAACRSENIRGLQRPIWRHADIMRTVGQGYGPLATEQVARWLVPLVPGTISAGGFARFIDRSYFGTSSSGDARFRFGDLNPRRPHLALNATILSPNRGGLGSASPDTVGCDGDPPGRRRGWLRRRNPDEFFHFAYTDVYFGLLRSDLDAFPVSGAVAASAAFPVLIDNAALEDHCRAKADKDRTLLLMDGGANDNQGMVEIYHILTELMLGQRRSNVPPSSLDRLSTGDTAYVFVVNSSVTDTTGPTRTGTGSGPIGLVDWISRVVSKVLDSVDVYSATSFNLRKNFYVSESRRVVQMDGAAAIRPIEIGLTGLDQYSRGGAQAALWTKSGLLDTPSPGEHTDPDLRVLGGRVALHRTVWEQVRPAASRRRLGLSNHHPQCYYDIRARLDASLLSLGENEKACLREAARWSTALVAQELCEASRGRGGVRPPDGLNCGGSLVSLERPGVLGVEGEVGGSCAAILDDLIDKRRRENPAYAADEDACRRLPAE